jgi:hypothetical protein
MPELLKTRCTGGHLILTESAIIVERKGKSQIMQRSAFADLDSRTIFYALFGQGGGVNLAFHGQGGKIIHANLVKPRAAKEVKRILTGRT